MQETMQNALMQLQPQYETRERWEAIARREDLRYEVLELSVPPALHESGRFRVVRNWLREGGRCQSVHGAFIDVNPGSGDEAFRRLSRQRCVDSCALARELGAKYVVFHSSHFPFLSGAYTDQWAAMCADFYQQLADTWQLRVMVENCADASPEPLAVLMRRLKDERVGVCLDIGHVNYTKVPLENWFDALGDRIGYLHLSDNNGRSDDHLPLGRGSVKWELADRLWRQLDRQMPVTLETGGPDETEASLRFLKENGYFGR